MWLSSRVSKTYIEEALVFSGPSNVDLGSDGFRLWYRIFRRVGWVYIQGVFGIRIEWNGMEQFTREADSYVWSCRWNEIKWLLRREYAP